MKTSVSPHMVFLITLASLSPLGAQSIEKQSRRPSAAVTRSTPAPAVPAAASAPSRQVRRAPVSFHPITVRNGPQPYVIEADSLQNGLALISKLYQKSGRR